MENFWFTNFISGNSYIEVNRFTPEGGFDNPEPLTTFYPVKTAMVHSFSITEDYLIFFFYPIDVNPAVSFLYL